MFKLEEKRVKTYRVRHFDVRVVNHEILHTKW
jgi:hypothetical protein